MVKMLLLILLFFNILGKEKFVIGSRPFGLFSNFFGALANIEYASRHSMDPVIYWGKKCTYWNEQGHNGVFDNAWEYYFYQPSDQKYLPGDSIYDRYETPEGESILFLHNANAPSHFAGEYTQEYRTYINNMIKRNINIKEVILKKAQDFLNTMRDFEIIAIHIRRTDKGSETQFIPTREYLAQAKELKNASQNPADVKFFIATDDQKTLDECISYLGKDQVFYYDSIRVTGGYVSINYTPHINQALAGEQVLIEALIMSQCSKFIYNYSNVAFAVLFFNPTIESYLMAKNRKKSLLNDLWILVTNSVDCCLSWVGSSADSSRAEVL